MPIREALKRASDLSLDLVVVSEKSDEVVCKIMEYGKSEYKKKKQKKNNKTSKIVVKTIKIRPSIDIGDFNTKMNQIFKFTTKGYKVKLIVVFKGREHAHKELGMELLESAMEHLADGNECIIVEGDVLQMKIEKSSKI